METGSERVRFDYKVLPREQAGGGGGNTELVCPRKYRPKRVNAAELSKF